MNKVLEEISKIGIVPVVVINDEKYAVLEPTYDEMNPPPPPPKEYRFSLGDSIYIGMVEYELMELGEDIVRLYDPDFPLINKEMPRAEFDEKVKENPFNNKYLHVIEQPAISEMETTEIAEGTISEKETFCLILLPFNFIFFNGFIYIFKRNSF